jgi:hypothetical protein
VVLGAVVAQQIGIPVEVVGVVELIQEKGLRFRDFVPVKSF